MDNFIILFAAIANIIAVLLVYYSFGKKMDKQKKFMNTLIGMGFICILVGIVFSLSSIGIEKIAAIEKAKTLLTIAFVPVDAILFIPFSMMSFYKCKEGKITKNAFSTRVIIVGIVAIIVLICEFFYFRNFQQDIIKLNNKLRTNQEIEEKSKNIINEEMQNIIDDVNIINEENTENNMNQVIENKNEISKNNIVNNTELAN